MKYTNLIFQLIICLVLLYSCNVDKSKQTTQQKSSTENSNIQVTPSPDFTPVSGPPTTLSTPSAPQNSKGIWHYKCPKGCKGGAGEQTLCSKCGATMIHNQEYHKE